MKRKLKLNRETLLLLTPAALGRAIGGESDACCGDSGSCVYSEQATCSQTCPSANYTMHRCPPKI